MFAWLLVLEDVTVVLEPREATSKRMGSMETFLLDAENVCEQI